MVKEKKLKGEGFERIEVRLFDEEDKKIVKCENKLEKRKKEK